MNLVKTCEGVLAKTTFGRTVEQMTGCRWDSNPQWGASRNWQISGVPKDTATVLRALFDLSNGKVSQITIAGATECAFIGAMAQWVFDLRVAIESDGPTNGQIPQVIIRYDSPARERSSESIVKIKSTSFYIPNADDFWSKISSGDKIDHGLRLKVPWESCLSRVYGTTYGDLCNNTYALAEMLGSAARIYSGFAMGESNLSLLEKYRHSFTDISTACHGFGLVHTIIATFPELSQLNNLLSSLELAQASSFSEALKSLERSYASMHLSCECSRCSNAIGPPRKRYCLMGVAYAILRMSRLLGATEYDPALLPSASGLQHFALAFYEGKRDQRTYLDILDFGRIKCSEETLTDPMILFVGNSRSYLDPGPSSMRGKSSFMTAISHSGVCVYADVLRHLTGQPELARIVHVLPGRIQVDNRSYNYVYDHPRDFSRIGAHYRENELRETLIDTRDLRLRSIRTALELKAFVTERPGAQALYFSYRVFLGGSDLSSNSILTPLTISPGWIISRVLATSCLIPCGGEGGCQNEERLQVQDFPLTHRIPTRDDMANFKFVGRLAFTMSRPEDDDLEQCIALTLSHLPIDSKPGEREKYKLEVLIRRHECIPCCVRAITNLAQLLYRNDESYEGFSYLILD